MKSLLVTLLNKYNYVKSGPISLRMVYLYILIDSMLAVFHLNVLN